MNGFLRRQVINLYQLSTGRHILARLDELNRTQWLSRGELLALQRDKLQRLLDYAYAYVPYYHRLFDQVGFKPPDLLADPAFFQKIPTLNKTLIRENFDDLLTTESRRRKQMRRDTTGGSTGQPLVFMIDADVRDYMTAYLHHHLGWTGWQFGQPHVYIWGAGFEIETMQSLRAKLMDWLLNRFITNAYVLSEETMSAFALQVRRRRPRLLVGYPSSLYHFAEFVRERGFDDIQFEAIVSSAEVLYPAQRQFIESVFSGKMFDRYGTREVGAIGYECEAHKGLHVIVGNNYVEILKDGQPVDVGEAGEVVVTNLNNYSMPFIRYCTEDVAAWHADDNCPCGRAHPMMEVVQGRRVDMFKTKDDRAVWGGFASLMFDMEGVKRFQLVQKSLDHVVVRIVKDAPLDEARLAEIERTVHIALGDDVNVEFEYPDEITIEGSGKYRYTISEIHEP
jgi:phenylacetate-CoA ligase